MFPQLAQFGSLALLLLRLMVGAVFVTSGWSHATHSDERSKSIGMSKGFTIVLGIAEALGGVAVGVGIFQQLAAIGLILVMLGAIDQKIRVWHTGFWGDKTYGWHYDLMLVVMNLVVLATNGGQYVLLR